MPGPLPDGCPIGHRYMQRPLRNPPITKFNIVDHCRSNSFPVFSLEFIICYFRVSKLFLCPSENPKVNNFLWPKGK